MTLEVTVEQGLYSSYTNHFSLGIYSVVFSIPAGFSSILIVKFFMNILKRSMIPLMMKEISSGTVFMELYADILFYFF